MEPPTWKRREASSLDRECEQIPMAFRRARIYCRKCTRRAQVRASDSRLALLLLDLGRFEEAVPLAEQALALRRDLLGG
jgi:hypothetical protein